MRLLGAADTENPKNLVEPVKRLSNHLNIAGTELSRVDRGIERRDELEHRAERAGGVEVVAHGLAKSVAGFPDLHVDLRMRSVFRDALKPHQQRRQPVLDLLPPVPGPR